MFHRAITSTYIIKNSVKSFSTSTKSYFKVAVAGASGGIGQPLSLLLKLDPLVTHLACYDIAKVTPGVAVDLSHVNTSCKVTGHVGPEQLCEALRCADVVVIPAGVPRKPGMSRDDLFNTNAGIVRDLTYAVAQNCPCAIVAIITNPVNSVVPIAATTMKMMGMYDPSKILGVTTLDLVRASTFVAEINCVDPQSVYVPVIGGHAGNTIIPVLSQSSPPLKDSDQARVKALTKRIQDAGTEVVKAKAGGGSATLSMAYAGARMVGSILKGLNGVPNVIECAYVNSNVTAASFFANPVMLGPCGISMNLGYGCLSEYELKLLQDAIPTLQKNIRKGEDFVCNPASKKK